MAEKTISLSNLTEYNNGIKAKYQTKTDNALTTTAKTVAGSINEINTSLENLTQDLNGYSFSDVPSEEPKVIHLVEDKSPDVPEITAGDESKILSVKADGTGLEYVNKGTITIDISGKVDKTTTVNNKPLNENITLTLDDVQDGIARKLSSEGTVYDLYNKKMCVIGDSISTYLPSVSAKNYWQFISEKTGCSIYQKGINGATIVSLINSISTCPTDSDIITLFAGTNDWHIGTIPLGDKADTVKDTVYGAVDEILKLIINRFPTKTILVYTPLPRTNPNPTTWVDFVNDRGYTLENIVDAIIYKCNKYSIPVLDLYRNSGYFYFNATAKTAFTKDGLHPNITYHEILGLSKMLPFIMDNLMFVPVKSQIPSISVTGVTLPATANVDVGANTTLTAIITPSNATNHSVVWSTSDATIATVDGGVITGVNKGTCIITATSSENSNIKANCTVTVANISVTEVTISPTIVTISIGGTQQLTENIVPTNATNKAVSWISSNTGIATVSSTGLVTGVASGSVTITCTTQDGSKTATSTIIVQSSAIAVTGVTLDVTSNNTIKVDETLKLIETIAPTNATDKTVTWTSSDVTKATVSSTGLVTAIAEGSCIITVKSNADNTKTATCTLTIQAKTSSIFRPFKLTLTSSNKVGILHLTSTMDKGNLKIGDVVTCEYDLRNCTNTINNPTGSATILGAPTSAYGSFSGVMSGPTTPKAVTFDANGNSVGTISATITSVSQPYWKFPVLIGRTDTLPVTINVYDIKVKVNGVEVPVLSYNSFFTSEVCTIEYI